MSIGEMLAATVPMARTLDLQFLETTPERAVVSLPDQADYHNHVGGPHATCCHPMANARFAERAETLAVVQLDVGSCTLRVRKGGPCAGTPWVAPGLEEPAAA